MFERRQLISKRCTVTCILRIKVTGRVKIEGQPTLDLGSGKIGDSTSNSDRNVMHRKDTIYNLNIKHGLVMLCICNDAVAF